MIGNSNVLSSKCRIIDSLIGNNCLISPTVELNKAVIPDNTSVYIVDGQWRCKPVDISILVISIIVYSIDIIIINSILASANQDLL